MEHRRHSEIHQQDEGDRTQPDIWIGFAPEYLSGDSVATQNESLESAPWCAPIEHSSPSYHLAVTAPEISQVTTINNNRLAFESHFNDAARSTNLGEANNFCAPGTLWRSDLHHPGQYAKGLVQEVPGLSELDTAWSLVPGLHHQPFDDSDLTFRFEQSASLPAGAPAPKENDDSDTAIGTILKNGKFKCTAEECGNKSYARPAELKRHYNTVHAIQKPEFWCDVPSCTRSVAKGGRPFHRKYRLMDHMQKMHTQGLDDMTEGQEESDADDTIGDEVL